MALVGIGLFFLPVRPCQLLLAINFSQLIKKNKANVEIILNSELILNCTDGCPRSLSAHSLSACSLSAHSLSART